MNLGAVVLRPDTPVGAVILKKSFYIPNKPVGYCNGNGGSAIGVISTGYPLSQLGNNIYETNIKGIGIRLYRHGDTRIDTFYPHELRLQGGGTPYSLDPGYFVVEIIRLPGPTGAGSLIAGLYSSYYLNASGPSKPILTSHVYGNSITIVNSTCMIDAGSRDISVDMGSVARNDFSGIGSTLNERNFNIRLNCLGGNDSEWSQKRGDVSLLFSYAPNPRWGNQGVIQPEGGKTSASGVGIQLLTGQSNTPVRNGDSVFAGHLSPDTRTTVTVPMKARYYQTDNHIAGGNVSALATFTLVYQ